MALFVPPPEDLAIAMAPKAKNVPRTDPLFLDHCSQDDAQILSACVDAAPYPSGKDRGSGTRPRIVRGF